MKRKRIIVGATSIVIILATFMIVITIMNHSPNLNADEVSVIEDDNIENSLPDTDLDDKESNDHKIDDNLSYVNTEVVVDDGELITVSGIMSGVYEDGSGYILDANDQNAAGRGYSSGIYLPDPIEINGEQVDFLLFTNSGGEWSIDFSECKPGDSLTISGILYKRKIPVDGGVLYYGIDIGL